MVGNQKKAQSKGAKQGINVHAGTPARAEAGDNARRKNRKAKLNELRNKGDGNAAQQQQEDQQQEQEQDQQQAAFRPVIKAFVREVLPRKAESRVSHATSALEKAVTHRFRCHSPQEDTAATAASIVVDALAVSAFKANTVLPKDVATRMPRDLSDKHYGAMIDHITERILAGVLEAKMKPMPNEAPIKDCIAQFVPSDYKAYALGRTFVGTPGTISVFGGRTVDVTPNKAAMQHIEFQALTSKAPADKELPKQSRYKALVLCGSSGSGKTTAAVAFGDCDVVVYLEARGAGVSDKDSKADRNKKAKDFVVKGVRSVLDEVCKQIRAKHSSPYFAGTLRVVVDECGEVPEFLRGCISVHESIVAALLELEQGGKRFDGVQVVYAGTGAEKPPSTAFGSSNELYSVVNMDDAAQAGTFPEHWEKTLQQDAAVAATWELIKADRSPAATVVRELLTNARAGALVVEWLTTWGTTAKRYDVPEQEPMRSGSFLAGVLASDVITRFMSMNGLQDVPGAERARMLTYALAVDAGTYDAIERELERLLVVFYGVLSDQARLWSRTAAAATSRVIDEERDDDDDTGWSLQVPRSRRSRYVMPRAYRAMWLWLAGQGCVALTGAGWQQLEQQAAAWAAALCACVTPERSLVELVALAEARQVSEEESAVPDVDMAALRVRDPFSGTCRLPWDTAVRMAHARYRDSKNGPEKSQPGHAAVALPKLVEMYTVEDGVPKHGGRAGPEARDGGLAAVLAGKAPPRVLVNAPMAPGADVLVASHSRGWDGEERREVVLIQAKARKELQSAGDWVAELGKFGVPLEEAPTLTTDSSTGALECVRFASHQSRPAALSTEAQRKRTLAKRTAVAPEFATQRELLYRLSPERVAVACVAIAVTPEDDAPNTDDKQAVRSTGTKSSESAAQQEPNEPAPKKWQRETAAELLRRLRVAAGFSDDGGHGERRQRAWSSAHANAASEAPAPMSHSSSRDFSLHAFVVHYDADAKSAEADDLSSPSTELIVDANRRATGRVRPAVRDALFPLRLDAVPTAAARTPADSEPFVATTGQP